MLVQGGPASAARLRAGTSALRVPVGIASAAGRQPETFAAKPYRSALRGRPRLSIVPPSARPGAESVHPKYALLDMFLLFSTNLCMGAVVRKGSRNERNDDSSALGVRH